MEETNNPELIKAIIDSRINKPKPSIKDNWLREDELCPNCGQVTKKAPGITKQNVKKLFSFNLKKDWMSTLIIILALLVLYDAGLNIKAYNEILNDPVPFCTKAMADISQYGSHGTEMNNEFNNTINITGLNKSSIPWMPL